MAWAIATEERQRHDGVQTIFAVADPARERTAHEECAFEMGPGQMDARSHCVTLGILDQSPIRSGRSPAESIVETVELAQAAERLGYSRYWVAEHHATDSLLVPLPRFWLRAWPRSPPPCASARAASCSITIPP